MAYIHCCLTKLSTFQIFRKPSSSYFKRRTGQAALRNPGGTCAHTMGKGREVRALSSKEPEKGLILLVIDQVKVPFKSINRLKKLLKAINEEDNVIILNLKHCRKDHCGRDSSQFQMCFKLDAFMRLDHLKVLSSTSSLKAFANSSSSFA